jgi:hypothetical protein
MSSKINLTSGKAADILREVPGDQAFHFYSAVGYPLNVSAQSLREFAERLGTVDASSLSFHSDRRDFENWVTMLGDNNLVKKLGSVRASKLQGEALRSKLRSTVRGRVDQLARLDTKSSG